MMAVFSETGVTTKQFFQNLQICAKVLTIPRFTINPKEKETKRSRILTNLHQIVHAVRGLKSLIRVVEWIF